ncbi:type II and III secretion system protein family protein [Caenispirillum salinarum]|uniref:type II and III secretion system protein family protein n=1 Tax=Caenispirillum salinarum TaxID=859058 RepID=UPI003851514F
MRPVRTLSARRRPYAVWPAVALALAAAVLVLPVLPDAARAQTAPTAPTPLLVPTEDGMAGDMVVPVDKSQVLRVDRRFTDILVGNPEVADVMPLTDRSIYVLGKKLGSTNLTIYGPGNRLIAVVDLTVTYDVDGLKARLHEIVPGESVEVRGVNGGIVLSGSVSSPRQLERVLSVAERYAPDAVTNLLSLNGSQQVMLSVKVAEMRRSTARQLGLGGITAAAGAGSNFSPVDVAASPVALVSNILDPQSFLTAGLGVLDGRWFLQTALNALEEKGAVKVLAEPNLIALSGDTATFLAGGEFPIPVAQDSDADGTTITVEFKQFGVSLGFTPTVLDGDLINLLVSPEVSQIDPSTSVTVSGFTIPGLSTRRTTTTVELRDGQSFAIAGLLQSNFSDNISQIPGIGDLPVLGALFRSTEFQQNETELVIIITPHLVQPAPPGALAAPTDFFTPPTTAELFLLGRVEGEAAVAPATAEARALGARPGGGISGPYGHILK